MRREVDINAKSVRSALRADMTKPTIHHSQPLAAAEVNFDGLIGPTHNYAGLSYGNLASQQHRATASNPRQAALQGLAKMKFLADLGIRQGVLPPQERPDLATLRRLGFTGADARVLEQAAKHPLLLASCCSASAMWAANAATVSPSADAADGKVHFTPANLLSQFHRSLERAGTAAILAAIFRDPAHFVHHPPLPGGLPLADEGAANHTRLATAYGQRGVEIFVYGREGFDAPVAGAGAIGPKRYPARQTREASEAIARLHQLDPACTLFLRQNPGAIDAGAFHNDVVAVGNENVLLYHADAFFEGESADAAIRECFVRLSIAGSLPPDASEQFRGPGSDVEEFGSSEYLRTGVGGGGAGFDGPSAPVLIKVSGDEVPLADGVRSYLFNSQLITLPAGGMALVCPTECREIASSRAFLERLPGMNTPIRTIHYVDVRQSMNNGGGPACLRLRVVLTPAELAATASGVFLTDALYDALTAWVKRHYREHLHPDDLADPELLKEGRSALDELTKILGIGAIYHFQS